jgi:phosphate transport system permease protein
MNVTLYKTRKAKDAVAKVLCFITMGIGLGALVAILWTLLSNGFANLGLYLFTQNTPPPGSAGGLANAIIGSLIMTVLGTAIATPIAILAGTYLAEFGRHSIVAKVTRFICDVLLSAPSIVIGLFVYQIVVVPMGHFSALAGSLALAIIVIPVVLRTTENMLALVPPGLREAAFGLGAPHWKVVISVSLRAARQGMITGVLLAIARISGETAPLLFTALNNQFWSTDLNAPMANLPVVIFQFALSPYDDWRSLAWAGALLITMSVLGLNILARLLVGDAAKQR